MDSSFSLSICVPTFNRPLELSKTLKILVDQISYLPCGIQHKIQCIISDNKSEYNVEALVNKFRSIIPIDLTIQSRNIGPTLNFEFCYLRALGTYVFILSDDDHLVDGALAAIMDCLLFHKPDILFLPFLPQTGNRFNTLLLERNQFLKRVGILPTLISTCILRRELISCAIGRYTDTNLHHYHYFLFAVEYGEHFEIFEHKILDCPYEDNSGGYNWFSVFGEQLFRIVDEFEARRIDRRVLDSIERDVLMKRIIPVYVKRRIHGVTISQNFGDDSLNDIFNIVSKSCRRFIGYWFIFLPIHLLPTRMLSAIKALHKLFNSY